MKEDEPMKQAPNISAQRVASGNEYCQRARAAKLRYKRLLSNCYLVPAKAQELADKQRLYYVESRDAGAFLIEEPGVYRCLYFADADGTPDLMLKPFRAPMVIDELCFRGHDVPHAAQELFARSGFRFLRENICLERTTLSEAQITRFSAVFERAAYAQPGDIDGISALLERTFDPYADRLPWRDELADLIEEKHVYVIREKGEPMACVVAVPHGSARENHWVAVDGMHRGIGFGSGLFAFADIDAFKRGCKRTVAWVDSRNKRWIDRLRKDDFSLSGKALKTYLLEA